MSQVMQNEVFLWQKNEPRFFLRERAFFNNLKFKFYIIAAQ